MFFSPWPLESLMIGGSNQVQRSSNFAGMITKDLSTCPQKESTNHSMVWEESKNFEQKRGFSLERQELRFEWTRDSRGISTRLDVLESLQRVTRSSENHSSSRAQDSSKENRIHPKQSTNRTRLNWIQNPGGHKEDWASFPDQSQYKNSKFHGSNTYSREEREKEQRGGGAPGRGSVLRFSVSGARRERREGRGI